jgi:hypothetical protein
MGKYSIPLAKILEKTIVKTIIVKRGLRILQK